MPKIINDKVKAIGSKVGATTNSKLLDDAVRHAVVLERYKKGEVAAINAFLDKEVVPELIKIAEKKLAKNAGSYSAKVVAETTFATNELLRSGMRAAGEKVSKNLGNLAVQEGRYHTAVLKTSIPVGLDMRTPSPELLKELIDTKHMGAAPLKGWFAKLGDDAAAGVAKQIRTGTAIGESVDDIVERLVGDPAVAGAFAGEMAKVKRDASAVVRTAVNHASTQAREASYAANADVIKGVKIVATLDERTTDVCKAQDGKVYPINEGPRPPFHFNCRTTTAPVTKSWKELAAEAESANDSATLETLNDAPEGARASMKGEVPASENYGTWLKKQPDAFQDEVLGPTRAQLFRDGRVPIDRFVDQSGRRLTLKELDQMLRSASSPIQVLNPSPEIREQTPETQTAFNAWYDTLSKSEKSAIQEWGGWDGSDLVRKYEAGLPVKDAKKAKMLADSLKSALDKAPKHNGVVYRGLSNLSETTVRQFTFIGSEIVFDASSSSSLRDGLAYNYILNDPERRTTGILFKIHSKTGVNVGFKEANMSSGMTREVILRKGTRYRVIQIISDVIEANVRVLTIELEEIL